MTASAIYLSYNFESGVLPPWTPLYENAEKAIEEEENGNKYLKLSYNGEENRGRKYYDVKIIELYNKTIGRIQIDYDLMYTNVDTEKDGELQVKYRTGPGSTQTTMLSRFGKNYDNFRYQNSDGSWTIVKDIYGRVMTIEPYHWYSIKFITDLDYLTQTIYIFDRDTGELLAHTEPIDCVNYIEKINMVTFSSGTDMCLDNVSISDAEEESGFILGEPYISAGNKSMYYLFGKTADGKLTSFMPGETIWEIVTPREGVSINSETGRVTVDNRPDPGPVIIKATRRCYETIFEAQSVINISR